MLEYTRLTSTGEWRLVDRGIARYCGLCMKRHRLPQVRPRFQTKTMWRIGISYFCLTSKLRDTVAWRGACASTIRDKQSCSLQRIVRLSFHFLVRRTSQTNRGFTARYPSLVFTFPSFESGFFIIMKSQFGRSSTRPSSVTNSTQ